MGKGNSTAHLPYKWDKMKPAKKSYNEDGLSATRKHKKPATTGMESIASSPTEDRPFTNG